MIPLRINNKHLCEIFEPSHSIAGWNDSEIQDYSIQKQMYPTNVSLVSETYSRDAERTADYELQRLILVNRKAKPEFTWQLIRAEYVRKLLEFLNYEYDFADDQGIILPREAEIIRVQYVDFTGTRTINAYLGQTLEGTLCEYNGILYWDNFRIAFPER